MGQVLIRKIKDETLDAYRAAAAGEGRSLEADLRALIERNRPLAAKDSASLLSLSEAMLAMTPAEPDGSDSTLFIRWDRDTDHGRNVDDGWSEDRETRAGR